MAKLLRLHITLEHIDPPVWRRVLIPADSTFRQLHDVLQIVFGWEDDHMHAFTVRKETISDARIAEEMNGIDENRVRVGDYLDRTGMRARYEYDFGDSWIHTIRLEATEEGEEATVRCLDGERAGPPEDCGGPWGYQNMLEALGDPRHPEHGMYQEWIGEWYPERFDRDEINDYLDQLARYWSGEYEVDEWVADVWEIDEEPEMPEIRFIPAHEEQLRAADFESSTPGTIVADFDALLDYVDEHQPPLTARGAPRPTDLRRMNQRLQAPLRADRPQPARTHLPDVYGVFLLLRASGLTTLRWSNGRPQLLVDQEALGQWRSLSSVEQYGHLLESWLFQIQDLFDDNILGAGDAGPWATLHMLWPLIKAGTYDKLPPTQITMLAEEMFGMPQLMLAEAFGWVEVERSGDEQAPIAAIGHRPFGEAILARIWKRVAHDKQLQGQLLMGDHPLASRGRLRGLFLPYWPGWRRSMDVVMPEMVNGRYTFSLTHDDDQWQLAIDGSGLFSALAERILDAAGLPANHLYRFIVPDVRYGGLYTIADPLVGEQPTAADLRVGEVGLVSGAMLYFHFDFNADRYFDLQVVSVEPAAAE